MILLSKDAKQILYKMYLSRIFIYFLEKCNYVLCKSEISLNRSKSNADSRKY